jgi:ABC-type phosphate/phosphonate transport system permease subunit
LEDFFQGKGDRQTMIFMLIALATNIMLAFSSVFYGTILILHLAFYGDKNINPNRCDGLKSDSCFVYPVKGFIR